MSLLKLKLRLFGSKKPGKPPVTPPPVTPPLTVVFNTFTHVKADLDSKSTKVAQHKAGTANHPSLNQSAEKILSDANAILKVNPFSIVNKPDTYDGRAVDYGPNTDKRNARSLSTYYWPQTVNKIVNGVGVYDASLAYVNPNYSISSGIGSLVNGNGYPYIKRSKSFPGKAVFQDTELIHKISTYTLTLGAAYTITKDEQYAQKAAALLQVFFLSNTTGMLPNVRFLSVVRGSTTWNGYGGGSAFVIVETLLECVEGFQLLRASNLFRQSVETGMLDWFRAFWQDLTRTWNTPPAKPTASSSAAQKYEYYHWKQLWDSNQQSGIYSQWNNIRVLYTVNVLTFALALGEEQWARTYIEKYVYDFGGKKGLVSYNFPNMPQELNRTIPWTYVNKNLTGWVDLARIGVYLNMDIANYVSPSGASMKAGVKLILSWLKTPSTFPEKSKQDIASTDNYYLAASRMRPLSAIYNSDPVVKGDITTYLNSLDTKYPSTSKFSEAYFRKGLLKEYFLQTYTYI